MAKLQMRAGAVAAALLLAGCGGGADNVASNAEDAASPVTTTVEDASPDSLVAPDNMVFDGDDADTSNDALTNDD